MELASLQDVWKILIPTYSPLALALDKYKLNLEKLLSKIIEVWLCDTRMTAASWKVDEMRTL